MSPEKPAPDARHCRVALIDYEFGNVRSVANALEALGAVVQLSRDEEVLHQADALILPGVGAFADGMANLRRFGLIPVLERLVLDEKKPFLGICVGMQLLAKTGWEGGHHAGLGWIDAEVVRFEVEQTHNLKVPHVGWNNVRTIRDSALTGAVDVAHTFYFVHSYYLRCNEPNIVAGTCEYGIEFPAIIQQGNIHAVQFHPEKSQKHGLALLSSFLTLVTTAKESPAC